MKVGDLVQLSAYARNLKHFYVGRDRDIGLIVRTTWGSFYSVRWCSDNKLSANMDRRDLKYAKSKNISG